MSQIRKLEKYCKEMLLDFEINGNCLWLISEKKGYRIIEDPDETIFDEDMEFYPYYELREDEVGYVYEFGGRWYTQEEYKDVSMTELKYIGSAKKRLPTDSFLGIRSGYELMNGIGLYEDWVAKAKFLGTKALGICEKNTLSGALVFQNECQKNDIKSIIGITIPVKSIDTYDVKLYAKDFQGWLNLLKFNNLLNVEGSHSIPEQYLLENSKGIYVIADPKDMDYDNATDAILKRIDYYQLDTVNFLNEDKDIWYIDNLEKFILSHLQPISITDAFYLEKADYRTREVLWTIGKAFDEKTDNQYFKSRDQYASELIQMFDSADKGWVSLYKLAQSNEVEFVENCNFEYDTDTRHLPKYIMSEKESIQFDTNEELFLHLIKKGFKEKAFKDPKPYIDRLKVEIDVLKKGDVIDYFLVLHDIIEFSKREELLTGIGRGSAGGSLIAYLLGIIQIDPLEFDLLFERFLNSGRMGEYQDRPSFKITLEDNSIVELGEGSLVRVIRDSEESVIFIHELQIGDDLIKY
jgi:DNA polymerase-3 subunit alpha